MHVPLNLELFWGLPRPPAKQHLKTSASAIPLEILYIISTLLYDGIAGRGLVDRLNFEDDLFH